MRELWTSGVVRLELLEWRPTAPERLWGTPIVAVHGAIGRAQSWRDEGEAAIAGRLGHRPRALGAFSRRGMGSSDAPPSGYGLVDFADDLAAAVDTFGYRRFVLVGHSLGVPIALSYAARRPTGLVGLVLGDYGPRYPAFGERWMTQVEERHRSGAPAGFDLEAARRMRADSREVDLSADLSSISFPVLVVTADDLVSVTAGDRITYETRLTDVRIVRIAGAGHMLSVDGRSDAFHTTLGEFVARFDDQDSRFA
jgi:pimeloyl-ACP methyl ester carboxylesterase